jgi:hypothetical protein
MLNEGELHWFTSIFTRLETKYAEDDSDKQMETQESNDVDALKTEISRLQVFKEVAEARIAELGESKLLFVLLSYS